MVGPRLWVWWGLLALCASGLLGLGACGGISGSSAPPPKPQIQHVVIIFQENRTPDNLFQDPNLIAEGADIVDSGTNSSGQTVPLTPVRLAISYDIQHSHDMFLLMYDGGKLDGADKEHVFCPEHDSTCPPPNAEFTSVDASDVQPYFAMAEQYTFADRMFQTNQGPSFPAHQFIISGTSAPSAESNLFASENISGTTDDGNSAGCTAPKEAYTFLIDPSGNETKKTYPCFDHPTLTDLLDARGISWRYYAPGEGSIWTAPNAISHMRFGSAWNNVILQQTQVLSDIQNGQLPAVSWVIPSAQASDHAMSNDGSGPSWVASIVNAIGNSQYWSNTAIIVAWDDWGGWYDHVAPKILNSYEYGFRVPMIVISPFAKAHYISHVNHDFGSVLKFVESVFGLPTVGYADTRADDLSDCFDFSQTPLTFQTIPAKLNAEYFLNDKTPPGPPDDD